jgi:FkbM family methyltransferase
MKPNQDKTVELITAYGSDFLIPAGDMVIGNSLRSTGQFETIDIERVNEYLDNCNKKTSRKKLFIDIGANIGTHSISALTEHGFDQVVAIEPSESNYRLLTANLCLHGLMDRCTCIQAAASNDERIKTLFHNSTNCGDYRLDNSPDGGETDSNKNCETVKTINAYSALLPYTLNVKLSDALCWIDTQGHEIPILKSLQPFLDSGLPVVIEFWPYGMEKQGGSYQELSTILKNPKLLISTIYPDKIELLRSDKLENLWNELRAADKATPEGASFCNILIHQAPGRQEVNPEERKRIKMTLTCRDSDGTPKVQHAGQVITENGCDYQLMHNGIKVIHGDDRVAWMSEIIQGLKGHHEPQEEKVFHEIVKRAADDGLMIELGCFWAYYSLWFLKDHPHRKAIGLEPDATHLLTAQKNANINGLSEQISFVHGLSSMHSAESMNIQTESGQQLQLPGYTLANLLAKAEVARIEIAHCDAQGAESHVVDQMIELGKRGQLRFAIVSTHAYEITGDPLTHQTCLQKLQAAGAHIIAEHDVHESYSGDGLIAASFRSEDQDLTIELSHNRYSTTLFPSPAVHLAESIQETNMLRRQVAELQSKKAKAAASPRNIKQMLKAFLPNG